LAQQVSSATIAEIKQVPISREGKVATKKRVVKIRLELDSPLVDLQDFNYELGEVRRHLESSLKWLNDQSQLIEPNLSGWRIGTFIVDDNDDESTEGSK